MDNSLLAVRDINHKYIVVVIENCIVESHSTINPNEKLGSEDSEVQIINERNFRYSL